MTLRKYIETIQLFAINNPDLLDQPVIYFDASNLINCFPPAREPFSGHYSKMFQAFFTEQEVKDFPEDIPSDTELVVRIN